MKYIKQIQQQNEPWWAPMMVEHVGGILTPLMSVFEYGSGASTIWLAGRCRSIISVEHDEDWYRAVASLLPNNGHILLAPRPYAHVIERYQNFDLIIVDGRDRVQCVDASLPHLNPGGYLLLDDCERERYHDAVTAMKQHGWGRCIAEQDTGTDVKKALLVRKPLTHETDNT
jgi:predicted O-methyltransferase YrrM